MYKNCNTEESASRQREIENTLLELMQTTPYAQITVGDICQKVGLSRKSFYRYFSNKDGCLHGLVDHILIASASAYMENDTPLEDHRQMLEDYFVYWRQATPLLGALCQNNLENVLFDRTLYCVANNDLDFIKHIHYTNREDLDTQILFMVCGMVGLLLKWHEYGYPKSPREMAATVIRMLENPMIAH